MSEELTLVQRHERCLYPCVRIRTPKALGSGTVLFVEENPTLSGMYDWYVLTNEHVIDNLVEVKSRWNSMLRREVKVDVLGTPTIEVFTYAYTSRTVGATGLQGEIVAYDKEEDLALLKVTVPYAHKHVAQLLPWAEVRNLVSFSGVWNIGCGMGEKPVITFGYLSAFGCEIENKDYFMVTAPSIFGNSGGATFLEETGAMIGVPARITVLPLGFSADIVTHMGFSITVERIYRFLDDQVYDFVYGSGRTSVECTEAREAKREADLRRRQDESEETPKPETPKARPY